MRLSTTLVSFLPVFAAADWSIKLCEDTNSTQLLEAENAATQLKLLDLDILPEAPRRLPAGQTLHRTVGDYTAWIWNFSPCAQPVSEAAFENAMRAKDKKCGLLGAAGHNLVTIGADTSYVGYGVTTTKMFEAWTKRYVKSWSWNLDDRCCALIMNKPKGRALVPEQRACMESYQSYWHTSFLKQQGTNRLL